MVSWGWWTDPCLAGDDVENLFVAKQFRAWVPVARQTNIFMFSINIMAMVVEDYRSLAMLLIATNFFALCLHPFLWLIEKRGGVLHAHSVFCLWNVANVLIVALFLRPWAITAMPAGFHGAEGPYLPAPICVLFMFFNGSVVIVCHLLCFSALHLAVIDCIAVWNAATLPPYTTLGHSTEFFLCLSAVLLGEYGGRTLHRIMHQAFMAAHDDQQKLKERMEQLAEEKERLRYDLAIEQSKHRSRRRVSSAPRSTSSYGSEGELAHILAAADALPWPEDDTAPLQSTRVEERRAGGGPGRNHSPADEESHGPSEEAAPLLSTMLWERLNASLHHLHPHPNPDPDPNPNALVNATSLTTAVLGTREATDSDSDDQEDL